MRWVLGVILAFAAAGTWAQHARGAETVVAFDPSRGEFPEGIAVDARGGMYVSLAPLGEIRRRTRGGSFSTFAKVAPGSGGFAVLGLATDHRGTVYAAAPTTAAKWHGVVEISRDGVVRRLPGTEAIAFPNGITLDRRCNMYVTDSIAGAVWRVSRDGDVARWVKHESLAGTSVLNPFPLGANGIAYSRGRVYVANTEKKQLVEIAIARSGAAGAPRVIHAFAGESDFVDGVAADLLGNLYVVLPAANRLMRIDRKGRVTTPTGVGDGLSMPASLTFGAHGATRSTLYLTNFSLPDFVAEPAPGIVSLDVRVPGPRPSRVPCG